MIEINGVKYKCIEQDRVPARRIGTSRMMAILGVYASVIDFKAEGSSRPSPSVNLPQEFKLIQEKKSKLSKVNRDWVIREFHKHYRAV